MDGGGEALGASENISRTSARPCGYVVAGAGFRARFCDRPALPGGSYCARHRALCAVGPGTRAGRRLIAEQTRAARAAALEPPDEPLAEPLEPVEREEALLDIDGPVREDEP